MGEANKVKAMTQVCSVCGSSNTELEDKLQSSFSDELLELHRCRSCGTLFYPHSKGISYDECSLGSTKFYIEFNAGLHAPSHFITNLRQLARAKPKPSFLDVGCAFGFALDMARYLGWDATGVEPSPIALEGQRTLQLNIIQDYLESADLPSAYDLVLSSETIEHVPDPQGFLNLINKYLKPDGILCLTTPNSEAYASESVGEKLAMASAGVHLNIFSPYSIGLLLERAGFADCRIETSGGVTGKKGLVVFATKTGRLPNFKYIAPLDSSCIKFMIEYLEYLVEAREKERDYLYDGALYRLVELYTNLGNLAQAHRLSIKLDESISAKYTVVREESIDAFLQVARQKAIGFDDYIASSPSFLSRYLYCKGMVCLNLLSDFARAEKLFTLAHDLFSHEQDTFRQSFASNWQMASRAKYHAALSMLYAKNKKEGLRIFDQLLSNEHDCPSDLIPQVHLYKGIAHLQLGEIISALKSFTLGLKKATKQAFVRRAIDYIILVLRQGWELSLYATITDPSTYTKVPRFRKLKLLFWFTFRRLRRLLTFMFVK